MDYGKRPPLDEQKSLWQATVAAEGVTTSDGEATGLSLIDAGLAGAGANSFVSMMAGDPTQVDSRDVTAFNNATGEVTVASAFKGGQVAAGVPYKIVTFRFVPAEVAALAADVGNASTSTLGSLFGILGDPATDLATQTADIHDDLDTHETAQATNRAVVNDIHDTLDTHETAQATNRAVVNDIHDTDLPAVKTDTAAIKTQTDKIAGKMLFTMDFWSDPVEEKVVTDAQVTAAVGASVTVADLPSGATVVRAIVMFKFRMVENTNAAENSLDCTDPQSIQVDDSGNTGWVTAINFVDEQFKLAATTRESGDVLIGDNNVAARVDGNDTYDFQWLDAKAHLANIQFNDIQMGIRIWYSV